MSKKKVLVVFLNCGNGHRRAAEAVEDILQGEFEVRSIDALEYAPSFVRWVFQEGYRIAVSFLPFIWELIFLFFKFKWVKKFYEVAGGFFDRIIFPWFIEEVKIFSPDIIISTHFTSSSLVARIKKEIGFKLIRDTFIFTNKRLILVDKQGLSGKKTEYLSIGYKSISRFSIETSGHFDLDAELKIWISSEQQASIQKKFNKKVNIYDVQKILAKHTC